MRYRSFWLDSARASLEKSRSDRTALRPLERAAAQRFLWDVLQSRGWLYGHRLAEERDRFGSVGADDAAAVLVTAVRYGLLEPNAPLETIWRRAETAVFAQFRMTSRLAPFLNSIAGK